ncbi:MAG: hypothetical protein M3005_00695 [Apilactobacillus sp.]|uniref:hypothetical protein n=1 Tax=Apilactobacillus TaxID=2767877 RepID=UPI0025E8183E|nr:hypothetical protein [Apilactobacillus sp.]MCT6822372.1 hypothetical protein [Apilactobacillus sp.]MCT6857714.1 hypothetical protein [Apilactobacillus sp.]
MLNLEKMMQQSITRFNYMGQKRELLINGNNKKQKIFIKIDTGLSALATDSKRFSVYTYEQGQIDPNNYKKVLLQDAVEILSFTLLYANICNLSDIIIDSQKDIDKITNLRPDSDFNQIYLSIKKMMFNAFYNHSKNDFKFFWKMLLKFILVDFNVDMNELVKNFEKFSDIR